MNVELVETDYPNNGVLVQLDLDDVDTIKKGCEVILHQVYQPRYVDILNSSLFYWVR